MGRQIGTLNYQGNRTTIVFDAYGRQVANIDEGGYRTTTVLDDFGRQINLGNKGDAARFTIAFDALGIPWISR